MNKHCYRLIFSRTHGELRVVSELARSCSAESGQTQGSGRGRLWITLRSTTLFLWLALWGGAALANGIVADSAAPRNQRPEVLNTKNGIPQVNIAKPNGSGISHNQYKQFDVNNRGAILNNSAVMTSTKTAGIIQGNPNLDPNKASARVILNEINSNNPSQIKGFLEVAGGKAQVIVANPSGIICNGCGTINAGRMTLTTGKPQFNQDGSLAGYQIERGTIRVEGGGLNADSRHDTPYVDLLARAVEINSGVWAKEKIAVVAGKNNVDTQNKATPIDSRVAQPEFAIDMGQMGGMYSGYIHMVGTEKGVGVRNQGGHIQADKTLTVSSNGKLSWGAASQQAITQAGSDITLTAKDSFDHHGKLHSDGTLKVESQAGSVTNTGTLAALKDVNINAKGDIHSQGNVLAGSDNKSNIINNASICLNSDGKINTRGSLLSKKNVTATGKSLDLSQTKIAASTLALNARQGDLVLTQSKIDANDVKLNSARDIHVGQVQIKAQQWDVSANNLFNQKGIWEQTGQNESQFALTGQLNNQDGAIEASRLKLSADSLNNQNGRLVVLGSAKQDWQINNTVNNQQGEIGSNGDLNLSASTIDNQSGSISSQTDLNLSTRDHIDNTAGNVVAGNSINLQAGKSLNNQSGTVNGQHVTVVTDNLNNALGKLISQTTSDIVAHQQVNNTQGFISSGDRLTLATRELVNNQKGTVQSDTQLTVDAQRIDNQTGKVIASQNLSLNSTDNVDNQAGLLEAGKKLILNSQRDINNQKGIIQADQRAEMTAQNMGNAQGQLLSRNQLTLNVQDNLDNSQGKVSAGKALQWQGNHFNNTAGLLQSGGTLDLTGRQLSNPQKGQILSQDALLFTLSGDFNNQAGILTSQRDAVINANLVNNAQGAINVLGRLNVQVAELIDNRDGRLFSQQKQTLQAQNILNQQGTLQSASTLSLKVRSINNQDGAVKSQKALSLITAQDYTHRAGDTLISNQSVTLAVAGILTNLTDWLLPGDLTISSLNLINQGLLVSKTLEITTGKLNNSNRLEADKMTLNVDALNNSAAIMGDDIRVKAKTLDNQGEKAVIAAAKHIDLHTQDTLTNRDQALIYSGDTLTLTSDNLIENNASFIEADGAVSITARVLNNLRSGLNIQRDAEKSDYRWHRYSYNWRSYGSGVNTDKTTIDPTTQKLTFKNDIAATTNPYGTLLSIDAGNKRAQMRVKNKEGQLTDIWVNYLALTPDSDGSYAMTFYKTRGWHQNNPPTPYHNTVWREFNRGFIEQWNPALHLDLANIPYVTDYNNFRERSVEGTIGRDKLISEGTGARILSGRDMVLNITDSLFNDASTITAVGDLYKKGNGRFENKGYSVNERRREHIVDHYDRDTRHWYPTFELDETTALTTIDGIISGNGKVIINGQSITNTTVNAAQISEIEAALNAVTAERAEFERNPLAFQIDGTGEPALNTDFSANDKTALTHSETISPSDQPLLPSELALTKKQHIDNVATFIPDNGLFRQNLTPDSPFLVVTDKRFTDRDKFISSDYLLARVGYSPADVHKRLGDGFYEQRLVREQVLKLTGRPSLREEDAMAQYEFLMNNGIKVAEDFHLRPGVALTPAQITGLQQDIVWLVSETVKTANGPQTVWMPKVYLASTTLRLLSSGAVISGKNLQLSAESVSNAGQLLASKGLAVNAEQFLHQGGDINAEQINIQAGSITLSSHLQDALRQASLSATDISLSGQDIQLQGAKLAALNDININARDNLSVTSARSTHSGDISVISGAMGNRTKEGLEKAGEHRLASVSGEWQRSQGSELNAGGNLTLNAVRDITLQGSQAKASGQLTVGTGHNLNILADTTTTKTHLEASSRTTSVSNTREEERLSLSTLSGDKGVSLNAGNHLLTEGTQVDSREGKITVSAKDVSITAATQDISAQDYEETRPGRKSKSSRVDETSSHSATGSTFSGQNGVDITARTDNITVTGSAIHSEKGTVNLDAQNNVVLNTATEKTQSYRETHRSKKGFLKSSSEHSIQNDEITRERGSLLSGEKVTVNAGKNATVKGSSVVAEHDVMLSAGNNVDITAATETDSHYILEEKKKSGLLSSGGIGFTLGKQSSRHEVDEKGTTQSQSVSTIGSTQGDVSIIAGNKLHVGGADLIAQKDLNLTGDDVQIDPGYDERTRTETFETKQSGLTIALSGTVGSALNTAVSTAQQARKESDGRLSALQNTKAVLSGVQAQQAYEMDGLKTDAANDYNTANDLKPGDDNYKDGATNTVGISASYGSQSSKSETRTDSRQSQGSTVNAGQNLSITATGKNQEANKDSGNITVAGSELKAGKDLSLSAAHDINLVSAQNTEQTTGKNSSKGGNLGIGIGVGSGGYGITVSAGVNAGKGHEKGNGLTHTETTVDAGHKLIINSKRDTILKGAQVSGEQVIANVGRNFTLQSEQDSDRYDAKQQNTSVGGSFTYGAGGSANISASQDKLHSNYDSVKEQAGIFAGKGGFDVNVKEHTQLDGAVIASTADKDKNRLDTGTLGWEDIENKADFSASHSGGSVGTGGSIGSQLITNTAGGLLSNANNSGHAVGITKSAVSDGAVIVRHGDKQKQDINALNRDTEHANDGSINPIFDKEKEQNRLKQSQLIGEIGNQTMDIIRTEGDIAGLKAQKDPGALVVAKEQLEEKARKNNSGKPSEAEIKQQAYNNAMAQYGTGSDLQKTAQAITGLLQGLAGDNLAGALANASSPYLATEIKKRVGEDNPAANAMVHAVLGAVMAELNNQSAVAGGLGAGGGELSARVISDMLFPGKKVSDLSESEKQQVSALSQLAGGLAGGLTTGDISGAVTAAQAGKNAVENNLFGSKDMPKGLQDYGQAVASWDQYAEANGLTPEQKQAGLDKLAKGDLPSGQSPATGLLTSWGAGATTIVAPVLLPATATAASVIGTGAIGGSANVFNQLNSGRPFSATDALIATGISGLTQGKGFWFTEAASITGAYSGAKLQGKDATAPMIGAGLGTLGGATIGKGVERLQTTIPQFDIPKLTGAIAESAGSEYLGSSAQNLAEKVQQKLEKKSDTK